MARLSRKEISRQTTELEILVHQAIAADSPPDDPNLHWEIDFGTEEFCTEAARAVVTNLNREGYKAWLAARLYVRR